MNLNVGKSIRSRTRRLVGRAAAPFVLKLALGETPGQTDQARFAHAFADQELQIPALLRGLLSLPQGRDMLHHVASYSWHWREAERCGKTFYGPANTRGNIYTAWTGRPLGFLHFEKCAGNALLAWLCVHFHPEQIAPAPYRDLPPHLFSRPPSLVDRARYPLIWGHYDLASLKKFDAERDIFTILREPRARLASLYRFWRSVNPAKFDPEISFAVSLAHTHNLEAFLSHEDPMLTDMIDNVYVRRLTRLYATGASHDPLHADPDAALAKAIEALDKLFFVGTSETLDKSAAKLSKQLKLAPPSVALRANVTNENFQDPTNWFQHADTMKLSQTAAKLIAKRTELDRRLYSHIERLTPAIS